MRIGFSCYSTKTKFPSCGGVPEGRGGLWWFATIVAIFITLPSFATPTATDRKTVSSKAYVDTSVETRQEKIPAAGTNSANTGTTVTNLPTMETSKLTCANQSAGCTLWTIEDQQVYGDEDNNGNGGN